MLRLTALSSAMVQPSLPLSQSSLLTPYSEVTTKSKLLMASLNSKFQLAYHMANSYASKSAESQPNVAAATSWSASISKCQRRRSEEHTSELQSQSNLVCRLLLEKKKTNQKRYSRIMDAITARQDRRAGFPS